MAFGQRPLIRDITQYKTDVSSPTSKLEITMSHARQIFPIQKFPAPNLLLITAGTIRFGQDFGGQDKGHLRFEDTTNEFNEDAEVDEGERRTVWLQLNDLHSPHGDDKFAGAASFGALGNGGFPMDSGHFLVAVDNAGVEMGTQVDERGNSVNDLWFLSDIVAGDPDERRRGDQLNRLGFQSVILLQRPLGK